MQAGRELDALIAEKIFGWTGVKCETSAVGIRVFSGVPPFDKCAWTIPAYSKDIAAAWSVVEKMIQRIRDDPYQDFGWDGPLFKSRAGYLTNEGYPLGTECWYVVVQWDGHRKHVCAASAPLAICLAALRSVGVEVSEEK